jgi:hypothetical protein
MFLILCGWGEEKTINRSVYFGMVRNDYLQIGKPKAAQGILDKWSHLTIYDWLPLGIDSPPEIPENGANSLRSLPYRGSVLPVTLICKGEGKFP